jgi:hypothetical protein
MLKVSALNVSPPDSPNPSFAHPISSTKYPSWTALANVNCSCIMAILSILGLVVGARLLKTVGLPVG